MDEVRLHRPGRDIKALGRLLVRQPLGNESHYVEFSLGKAVPAGRRPAAPLLEVSDRSALRGLREQFPDRSKSLVLVAQPVHVVGSRKLEVCGTRNVARQVSGTR